MTLVNRKLFYASVQRVGLRGKQVGLSLVELMVATALSSIIVLSLAELYINMARTNQEMAKTNSQIENARFAMQFLQYDLMHAGYWGGFVPQFDDLTWLDTITDTPNAVPDPCLAFTTPWSQQHANNLIGLPVAVTSGVPGSCGGLLSNKLANTDVLVVRHADTCVAGGVNCEAETAGQLYFQASNCATELDLPIQYVFLDPTSYPLLERDCLTVAGKRRFAQTIYYIRDFARTVGDGIPTLVRSEFGLSGGALQQLPPQPLVEGIERFRVELGLDNISDSGVALTLADYGSPVSWSNPDNRDEPDNRGDGVADEFVHCGSGCNVAQLINVVEVRLHLLARAVETTAGYQDNKTYSLGGLNIAANTLAPNFKRHVFSSSIRLTNISGRRETP